MDSKKALYEQVAEKLILQLEQGTSPFQKPWTDVPGEIYRLPYNPTTGNSYKGMNTIWLSMHGREDPRWLTFKQAEHQGWTILKGSRGTLINFVKTHDHRNIVDEQNRPVLDLAGKPVKAIVRLDKPVVTFARVFNAEQVFGIPPLSTENNVEPMQLIWSSIKRAEVVVHNSGANVKHGGNEAYYRSGRDYIQIPKPEQFSTASKYYSVLLHELGHWTGHKDRLDRTLINRFGTPEYAREELRAEIASLLLGSELNIGHDFSQHAAYVSSWIKVLKEDPFEIHRASAEAQKISDYIMGFELKRTIKHDALQIGDAYTGLSAGEMVEYRGKAYKVLSQSDDNSFRIEDQSSRSRFRLSTNDGLYTSLVNAKTEKEVALEQTAQFTGSKSIKR